jgi:hypothetical protein
MDAADREGWSIRVKRLTRNVPLSALFAEVGSKKYEI